jgi:serine/threonine protein kinase
MISETISHYRILHRLGAGGMGEVYLAEDTRLGRKVALKLLPAGLAADEEAKRRFTQEARAASALNHPHIITIYEIGTDLSRDFIAMEYVEGKSLRSLLARGKIELRRAAELAAQAASGLAAAHETGIFHRDIKPDNLMVSRAGQLKILDFGLAKLREKPPAALMASELTTASGLAARAETTPGTILGTVAYMSPEQAAGRVLDRRTDIFSLGVVLYEMLTGQRPFQGKSGIDILHAIIHQEPRPVMEVNPRLPAEVAEILSKALAKEVGERYQHAGDFELDLRRLKRAIESNSLLSVKVREAQQAITPRVWHAGLMQAAISALALLGVATAAWMLGRQTARPAPTLSLEQATFAQLTSDPGYEGEPALSPDSTRIAYVSDRRGNFDIFLKQVSGGPDIPLTSSAADDVQPAFSPDGQQIAFVSTRSSRTDLHNPTANSPLIGGDIWVMSALGDQGGSARRIVEGGNFPAWSPDGEAIIYSRGPWFGQKLYRVAASGGEAREIPIKFKAEVTLPGHLFYPSYSSDGRWIVFEARGGIWVVSAEGGEAQRVAGGRHPVWNPASGAIIYSNTEPGKNQTLWQVPFSLAQGAVTGNASPLTAGRGRDTQAAVARDGKLIVFAAQDVSFNVEVLPFDAEAGRELGPPQPLTRGNITSFFLNFSPDGRSVVFQSTRGSETHIWKVSAGSDPIQLTSDPNFNDSYPRWAPDGSGIGFVRQPAKGRGADPSLWLMNTDGSHPRVLVEKLGLTGLFVWMPDGRALIVLEESRARAWPGSRLAAG